MTEAVSPHVLGELRRAASLVAHIPVGIRLHGSAGPVLEVVRAPEPDSSTLMLIAPCAFRLAVVNAWSAHRDGLALGLRGFTGDDPPRVEYVLPDGGWTDNHVVHHLTHRGATLHVFATTAPIACCRIVGADLDLCVHHDAAIAVTLLATVDDDVVEGTERAAEAAARLFGDEIEDAMVRADAQH